MTDRLEMLTAREQLMEDIDSIVEAFCWEMWEGKYPETQEDLTRLLCDAVCKNFPTNWIMNYSNFWDNVLKQEEWNDDLKRWENTHPEYKPFKEDSDSQRQQNLSNWWKDFLTPKNDLFSLINPNLENGM